MASATVVVAAVGWFSAVAWLLARAIGQFRAYETVDAREAPLASAPTVTVIVPARNESRSIGACLGGMLAQDYPRQQLMFIVVDDQSTDGTAAQVRHFMERDSRLAMLQLSSLPAGWTGKPNACWQGALQAAGEWLCFVDADTVAQPALLRAAVAVAERRGIDLLSLEPRQVLGSFGERLILPCGLLLAAVLLDLRRFNDPRLPDAAANGQFLLIRRSSYQACGGHRSVRGAIAEDTALARLMKHNHFRVALLGADALIETRMYRGLGELWRGLRRNLVVMTGGLGVTLGVAAAATVLAVAAVTLPVVTVVFWRVSPGLPALVALGAAWCASLALCGTHVATARHLGIPLWYGLAFPLGYLVGSLLAVDSVLRWNRGDVSWKGRSYAPSLAEAARPTEFL